jgi:hypothetical protein
LLESRKRNRGEIEEEKYHTQSEQPNKRIAKMNRQNLCEFDRQIESEQIKNYQPAKESKDDKLFQIAKVNTKKESSQESFYNISSEEQKQMEMNYPFLNKNLKSCKDGSDGDSNTSASNCYICLSSGKVIIKGNEIETYVA